MRERFARILDRCRPYLVASPLGAAAELRPLPLGLRVPDEHRFNPHVVASGPFLNVLQRLDELTFGPVGMPMPRWVFYDCAEVPGGIFGFGLPAAEVPEWVRRALKVEDDYEGLVPLSMLVSIPMLEPGAWHTYTLCSINEVAPGAAPAGLRLLTCAAGLSAIGATKTYGATQWRSSKLYAQTRFGPLDLLTAWTPAHSDPRTLTFQVDLTPERIDRALSGERIPPPEDSGPLRFIDCDDDAELQSLQVELEAGARFVVTGPPAIDGSFTRVPVREIPASTQVRAGAPAQAPSR